MLALFAGMATFSISMGRDWLLVRKEQQQWQQFRDLIYQIRANALAKHQQKWFCVSRNSHDCASKGSFLLELNSSSQVKAVHAFPSLGVIWHGFPAGDVLSFSAIGIPRVNGHFDICFMRRQQAVGKIIIITMSGQIRVENDKQMAKKCE